MSKKKRVSNPKSRPRIRDRAVSPIVALRVLRGLRQLDLARQVGCDQTMISNLEMGKDPGSPDLRARIAAALGVEPVDIFPDLEGADVRST
jgi:transcriptional regulator with XRE-family HTH domain